MRDESKHYYASENLPFNTQNLKDTKGINNEWYINL